MLLLCFRCATVYRAKAIGRRCPECGFVPEPDLYDKVVRYAADAARFGHHYREYYERNRPTPDGHRKHALLPEVSTGLAFVGVAVLSGVIGGASYDLVRAAVRRIAASLPRGKGRERDAEVLELAADAKRLRRFTRDLSDYLYRLEELPAEVRDPIVEEVILHAAQKRLFQAMPHVLSGRKGKAPSVDEVRQATARAFADAMEALADQNRHPKPDDFDRMWKNIRRPD